MRILRYILFSWFAVSLAGCERANDFYYDYSQNKAEYDGTIYNYLINQPGVYDSLVLVLERVPELKNRLNSNAEQTTCFAINNRSFEIAISNLNTSRRVEGRSPLYIEDFDIDVLDTLIHRYVFDEPIDIELVKPYLDGVTIVSAKYDYDMHAQYNVLTSSGFVGGGEQQIIFSDVNESDYKRYWQSVPTRAVDLRTSNGIMHTISSQHDFGFGKLSQYFINY